MRDSSDPKIINNFVHKKMRVHIFKYGGDYFPSGEESTIQSGLGGLRLPWAGPG